MFSIHLGVGQWSPGLPFCQYVDPNPVQIIHNKTCTLTFWLWNVKQILVNTQMLSDPGPWGAITVLIWHDQLDPVTDWESVELDAVGTGCNCR